MAPKVGQSAP